jgi:NTE family protein
MAVNDLKIGIALSGGGVRAAVFHLGVLGRLAEDGLLEKITRISTVSGGTLVTGLIYSIAGNKWPTSDFYLNKCLVQTQHYLTTTDVRRRALFRGGLHPIDLIQRRANLIAKSMQDCWGISASLNDIPLDPRWILNATTYESGKNWRFIPQRRMGDYIVNYIADPNISLTDAMAASAAYPSLIGPLVLDTKDFSWFKFEGQKQITTQPRFKKLHLWDGGVYDNLGVEALFKIQEKHEYQDDYNFLVVSDASNAIQTRKRSIWFWEHARRLMTAAIDQIRSLRSRSLINHFETHDNSGVYFKIGNTGSKILADAGIDNELIDELTKNSLSLKDAEAAEEFKTTLRKLTKAEYDLLYRHGWEVANFTLQARCPNLFQHKEYKGIEPDRVPPL